MKSTYVVSTIPVRDADGAILGWVRVDVLADGSRPTDEIYLRDGSGWSQAEAMRRIQRDPGLLYASEDDAARDGLRRLMAAERRPLTGLR